MHVRAAEPLSCIFCCCEFNLRVLENLPELRGEVIRPCDINLLLLVQSFANVSLNIF